MRILLALKSLKADWIFVVTGTGFAVVAFAISYIPIAHAYPWIPWSVFIVLWSVSWGWAFVRSWNREHAEMERLRQLLLREYTVQVAGLHKSNIVWNIAHERDLLSKMNGDEKLIHEAIEIVKSRDHKRSIGVA